MRTAAAAVLMTGAARAQPAEEPGRELGVPPPQVISVSPGAEDWSIRVEPLAWYIAPGGQLRLPGEAGAGNGDRLYLDELNLDSPRIGAGAEVSLREGRWRLVASGAGFESTRRRAEARGPGQIGGVAFAAGESLESRFRFATYEAGAAYRIADWVMAPQPTGGFAFIGSLEALGGMRFYDIDVGVRGSAGTAEYRGVFGEPVVGVKLNLDIVERFTIDVQVDVGYFSDGADRTSASASINSGFQWHITPNIGAQVGYRIIGLDLTDNAPPEEFDFRGSTAGLYAGAVLRF